jgi:hypothetical protein
MRCERSGKDFAPSGKGLLPAKTFFSFAELLFPSTESSGFTSFVSSAQPTPCHCEEGKRRGNPAEAWAAPTTPQTGLTRPLGLAMTKREKLPAKTFFPIAETLSPSPNG